MGSELIAAFDRADADDEVRAIIVTGAGPRLLRWRRPRSGGETFDYRRRARDGRQRRATTAAN